MTGVHKVLQSVHVQMTVYNLQPGNLQSRRAANYVQALRLILVFGNGFVHRLLHTDVCAKLH